MNKIIVKVDSEQYYNLTDRLFSAFCSIDVDDIENEYYNCNTFDEFLDKWKNEHNVEFV